MIFFRSIIEGLREIMANRFRSVVTMSGIIMGVASLMTMFALTEGMAVGFRKSLISVGGLERVEVDDAPVPIEEELFKEMSHGKSYADVAALRASAPLITLVSPELRPPGWQVITYYNKKIWAPAVGVEQEWIQAEPFVVTDGRFISAEDQEQMNCVVVVGSATADRLFKDLKQAPVGKIILIQGYPFTIIGVVNSVGMPWRNNVLLIPFQTCKNTLTSANVKDLVDQGPVTKLDRIVLRIEDLSHFQDALRQARNVLEKTRNGVHDFGFRTQEEWFDGIERVIASTRMSGIFISAVSLVVGGVGITNIMLATIRQRIREIGIRRAVGARSGDIFIMILVEGSMLAVIGGLFGLFVGWGMVSLLVYFAPPDNPPIIREWSLMVSFGAALMVGTFSCLYPAFRASKLSPMEALKYE